MSNLDSSAPLKTPGCERSESLIEGTGTSLTVGDIASYLDRFAPTSLAADWDNVGLLLGERSTVVQRLMTCLTVTPTTASEAIERSAQLIVTHHPILFRGIKRMSGDSAEGKMLLALARAGIAVYSPHTAFDNTVGGINELLANYVDLVEVKPLRYEPSPPHLKLVVFVPDTDLEPVCSALFAVPGVARIGEYSECSYRLRGLGTFHGSEESNPTLGEKGQRETVDEWRLEILCPTSQLDRALTALRQAHSYEEPAFDLYPLHPIPSSQGTGRVGLLPQPTPVETLAHTLKTRLRTPTIQLVGDRKRIIQRVAIICGSGGSLLDQVLRSQADLFITGELSYHDYLKAEANNLTLLLPGHHASERCGVEELARRLQTEWPTLQVWASEREQDPVSWL